VKYPFEAHDAPDIVLVWEWFQFQNELLAEGHAYILGSRTTVSAVAHRLRPYELRFKSLTPREISEFFFAQTTHLELLTMFAILATTEAILRIEFNSRVDARRKDGLSRRFRKIKKANGDKVRLDEDILGALKEEGVPTSVVGDFRGVLKLRDWLAHGRHWRPNLGQNYVPGDVFDIAKKLIDHIPAW
jgi:hypothetical protein